MAMLVVVSAVPLSFFLLFWRKDFILLVCGKEFPTASLKVMKIFSHPQTRNQSQVVQNDKLSRENVETKIFVGGNGTFSHVLEKN